MLQGDTGVGDRPVQPVRAAQPAASRLAGHHLAAAAPCAALTRRQAGLPPSQHAASCCSGLCRQASTCDLVQAAS